MKAAQSVQDFLEKLIRIENDPALFEFKLQHGDFLIWPLVRERILRQAIFEYFHFDNPWKKNKYSLGSYMKYLFLNWKYSAWRMPEAKILIFASDITNIKVGDSYFNRVTDCFADVFKSDTIKLECSNLNSYKRPRFYDKVYSWDSIALKPLLWSKLRRNSVQITPEAENFVLYLKKNLGYTFKADYYKELKIILSRYEYRFPLIYHAYSTFFKKKKPSCIILEQGCYGADSAIIIKVAKELGIRVAEIQHGYIGKNHTAYMYGAEIDKRYLTYLPDDFLSYGKYWSKNCQLPIPVINIGNPYLIESTKCVADDKSSNLILYISSAVDPDQTINEVLYINEKMKQKGFNFAFRPHPSELSTLNTKYEPIIRAKIPIDTQNLYVSLGKATFVISNSSNISTVMYEALAFKCKVVLISGKGKEVLTERPQCFEYLDTIDNLDTFLIEQRMFTPYWKEVWECNWKEKYTNYIIRYLN